MKLLPLSIILTIVGLISIFSITTVSSMSEDNQIHPCQQVGLEHIALYDMPNEIFYSMNLQEHAQLAKEYEIKLADLQQRAIQYNCLDMDPEWFTEKYQLTLQGLIEK